LNLKKKTALCTPNPSIFYINIALRMRCGVCSNISELFILKPRFWLQSDWRLRRTEFCELEQKPRWRSLGFLSLLIRDCIFMIISTHCGREYFGPSGEKESDAKAVTSLLTRAPCMERAPSGPPPWPPSANAPHTLNNHVLCCPVTCQSPSTLGCKHHFNFPPRDFV